MKLPFGKHRGQDIADPDIDVSYLKWVEEQGWINDHLREALNHEIERREGDRPGIGRVVKEGR